MDWCAHYGDDGPDVQEATDTVVIHEVLIELGEEVAGGKAHDEGDVD